MIKVSHIINCSAGNTNLNQQAGVCTYRSMVGPAIQCFVLSGEPERSKTQSWCQWCLWHRGSYHIVCVFTENPLCVSSDTFLVVSEIVAAKTAAVPSVIGLVIVPSKNIILHIHGHVTCTSNNQCNRERAFFLFFLHVFAQYFNNLPSIVHRTSHYARCGVHGGLAFSPSLARY